MKKNLSNIKALAILLAASAIITACTSDELVDPAITAKTYTLTINAVNGGDNGSTRALSLDGKTLNAAWATDETIYVKKGDAEVGTLNPETNGVSALLKGTLTGNFAVGQTLNLTYPRATIDYSGQVGTLSDIAAKYNYATATATITNVSGSTLAADNGAGGPVVFENQQAIVKFTLVDKAEGTPLAASQLAVNADGATYTVTPEAPVSELYVAIPGISSQNVTVTATVGGETYTFEQPNVTFSNGQYYAITVKMSKVSDDYLNTPLTFEAKTAGAKVTFTRAGGMTLPLEYSTDGITWNLYRSGGITLANVGDKVSFRGDNAAYALNTSKYSKFTCSRDCYVYGNIMSLVNSTDYATATELTSNYTFYGLFYENSCIYNKNIELPATTLTDYCYSNMFYNCRSLTTAPELPATTLANSCYAYMFYGCTGLTTAPVLSATTMADECCYQMFYGCTSLTTAPELSATTLAKSCYAYMFYGCTSLTTAPVLSATTMAEECCYNMFSGCTSLTTAPEMHATTLGKKCCYEMFKNCTSLTTAPELPATTLAYYCYYSMFEGCTSLITAPELSATTLADGCYYTMFYRCTSLTTAPELPATTLTEFCYFTMFAGCTSLTTAPALPAMTLAQSCYGNMFGGCTSLTTAPELPATTLAQLCFSAMFYYCTSLTTAPELPATTLVQSCYSNMFQNCTNLNNVKCLAKNISATNCTKNWLNGVSATGTFTKAAGMNSWTRDADGIPSGWTAVEE